MNERVRESEPELRVFPPRFFHGSGPCPAPNTTVQVSVQPAAFFSMVKSVQPMSFEYEPSSEPLHVSVKQVFCISCRSKWNTSVCFRHVSFTALALVLPPTPPLSRAEHEHVPFDELCPPKLQFRLQSSSDQPPRSGTPPCVPTTSLSRRVPVSCPRRHPLGVRSASNLLRNFDAAISFDLLS